MKKRIGLLGVTLLSLVMYVNPINASNSVEENLVINEMTKYTEPTELTEPTDCGEAFSKCNDKYPEDYKLFSACMFGAGCD